ncbi:penicillin acylase family protein [Marinobacter sp. chi1]|uniref:Penicillin acylase family protein n=1 Tax=Marinobacter suaedae TaxID=3057675 RepID=A0ABT8W393_9GAMM|nr:penicillin acylase family protein [Marinobacter sp. chi1]MDO3722707.1 penicillin acylase family protein [Marinobacter sp. chi1]
MKTRVLAAGQRTLGYALVLSGAAFLSACSDGEITANPDAIEDAILFPGDGKLEANIRRTTDGVPHITADNLQSAAFGNGYAQAQDNVCMLAEAIVKARSERAKYFGPGPNNINIINDFSFKAQKILSGAEAEFDSLSDESRALVEGFTAGYNKYIAETDPADFPQECRNQPWVTEIQPTDLLAHYRIVGQYASGALFATGAVFVAVPGEGTDPEYPLFNEPLMAKTDENYLRDIATDARALAASRTNFADMGLASNAWGIGSEMTEQGRGALLANPHFPYTGHRRLYQVQMTVPGYLNINGAGLLGTAIPLINFNENLAWSHTVTTSRRFTVYELTLKDGDPLTYIKDGEEVPITQETFQIEVMSTGPEPDVVERTFYFSEYGPMLSGNAITADPDEDIDGLPRWGEANTAYTYRDANANTSGLLDTWLAMSRATNLEEFQDVFRNCGSTLWTNSTYADADGNAFYIDSSSVPNLSPEALSLIEFKRKLSPEYDALFSAGLTLLDGNTSRDDWVETECGGLVTYDQRPKLLRTDWVQNSNSSYWATNPAEFLTGYSPLFGAENAPLNPRTRLGIKMLQNPLEQGLGDAVPPAGDDGKFGAVDLINVIWNNRAWYAEEFLPELRERCSLITATDPVVDGVDLTPWCAQLQTWDSLYDLDSVGAHIFRVFIANYQADFIDSDLTVEFDPADPVNTPTGPSEGDRGTAVDPMLRALAAGVKALDGQGIAPEAELGSVQYYRPSGDVPPGGTPLFQSEPIPWHGGDGNIDGAFNAIGVVTSPVMEDTVFPRIAPTVLENTARLSDGSDGIEGWLIARGTSWHFGLEFTDNGPEAYGLVSYSQSTDSLSEFFTDQSERYSRKDYRKLYLDQSEIEANVISELQVSAEVQ